VNVIITRITQSIIRKSISVIELLNPDIGSIYSLPTVLIRSRMMMSSITSAVLLNAIQVHFVILTLVFGLDSIIAHWCK